MVLYFLTSKIIGHLQVNVNKSRKINQIQIPLSFSWS